MLAAHHRHSVLKRESLEMQFTGQIGYNFRFRPALATCISCCVLQPYIQRCSSTYLRGTYLLVLNIYYQEVLHSPTAKYLLHVSCPFPYSCPALTQCTATFFHRVLLNSLPHLTHTAAHSSSHALKPFPNLLPLLWRALVLSRGQRSNTHNITSKASTPFLLLESM